jgi:hypothetical protein
MVSGRGGSTGGESIRQINEIEEVNEEEDRQSNKRGSLD